VVVAVAAAHAAAGRVAGERPSPDGFLEAPTPYVVEGRGASRGPGGRSVAEAGYELGNGSRVTAQDTVPFAAWVAATVPRRLPGRDYPPV
jgi:hypothetical protein